MSDVEKHDGFEKAEHIRTSGSDDMMAADEFGFSQAEQKSIIRRLDLRLVVTVGLMYCVSLMDRTNLSAAAVAGMNVELKMVTNNHYNIVTLVFFTTYIVFQPPSTVIVRKLGPKLHLSFITLCWGAVMIGMGFVKTSYQLMALRVILGIFEAGFFPSCVYLLSTWYCRYEMGRRYALFYMLGCVASAFAGILAYGLMQIAPAGGLSAWRWIFVVEGILTCCIAVAGYFALVGFPDNTKGSKHFLSDREISWVVSRVNADRGDTKVLPFNMRDFLRGGADLKVWAFALMFFDTTTVSYALAYFMPIILRDNMKFSLAKSQCLVAPPYAFAGIIMWATGWWGDRHRYRGPIIMFNMTLCLIGLPIMGWAAKPAVRYFGIFLVTAGANANIPAVMAYQGNNIRGQWKRAFCSALLVGFGGVGGIAGGLAFRTQDKPNYRPGLFTCIATSLLTMILVVLCTIKFKRDNARADRGEIRIEESDEDHQHGFRYTY